MLIRFTYFGICIDHVVLGIRVRKTAFGVVFWVKNSARCFPQAFAPRQCALDFSRQNKRRNVGGRCSVDNRRTSIPDRRARTCRNGCEHYSLSSYVSLHKSRKVVFKVRNFEFAIFEAFVRNCNCLHKLVATWWRLVCCSGVHPWKEQWIRNACLGQLIRWSISNVNSCP